MALTTCPECKKEISDTAAACPNCGYDLKASKTKSEEAKASKTVAKGCGTGCLVIVLIAIGFTLVTTLTTRNTPTVHRAKTGETATIRTPNGGEGYVAVSKEAFDRMTTLAMAKDNLGLLEMLAAGSIWIEQSGTECLVIDSGISTSEVRILKGPHAGQAGLVSNDWLSP